MSKKTNYEAHSWSDFKRYTLAGSKTREMSAIYGSSPRKNAGDLPSCGPASTPFSFTKVLLPKASVHTCKYCRIILPSKFCKRHNLERNLTMTDSSGRRLWHMRFQSWGWTSRSRRYIIGNGWKEFSYDHNLKINDRLVFTLMSTAHFVVEFANSKGSTRAMLPRRNGKDYPWRINHSRLDCVSFSERHCVEKKTRICKDVQEDEGDEEYGDNRPANTSRSFTKTLLKSGIHTAKCCRLFIPRQFCEEHNVEKIVTMTDSTGHRLWPMRMQSCGLLRSKRSTRFHCISNGWREFSYDHSLKVNDRLVFTLLSTSHFLVEYLESNGSTREMLPTKDGKNYPWPRKNFSSPPIGGDQEGKVHLKKKVASTFIRHKQKVQNLEMFCKCQVGKGIDSTIATKKEYVLPELTYLECKNADGSSYLQIIDSDSESTRDGE